MDKIFVKIYGQVQGIGYRWFVLETAKKYNLSGWVKNCQDLTVECAVKGSDEEIKKFLNDIKTKHPLAFVEKMEIKKFEEEIEDEFLIKR